MRECSFWFKAPSVPGDRRETCLMLAVTAPAAHCCLNTDEFMIVLHVLTSCQRTPQDCLSFKFLSTQSHLKMNKQKKQKKNQSRILKMDLMGFS